MLNALDSSSRMFIKLLIFRFLIVNSAWYVSSAISHAAGSLTNCWIHERMRIMASFWFRRSVCLCTNKKETKIAIAQLIIEVRDSSKNCFGFVTSQYPAAEITIMVIIIKAIFVFKDILSLIKSPSANLQSFFNVFFYIIYKSRLFIRNNFDVIKNGLVMQFSCQTSKCFF